MRILNDELRIITPTEKTRADEPGEADVPDAAARYQLTHDYLVPSLREWLTRKLRETRRGRATLCLEQRAEQWNKTPQTRFLPSPGEYLQIVAWAPRDNLTAGTAFVAAGRASVLRAMGRLAGRGRLAPGGRGVLVVG